MSTRGLLLGVVALLFCGCMESVVRSRAASQFDCPESQIKTAQLAGSDWLASGCGKEATYVCMAGESLTACMREGDIHSVASAAAPAAAAATRPPGQTPGGLPSEGGTAYEAARDIAGRWMIEADRQCRNRAGPHGAGRATLTFAGDGRIAAVVLDPPFDASDTGRCLIAQLRTMTVPPFEGIPLTVHVDASGVQSSTASATIEPTSPSAKTILIPRSPSSTEASSKSLMRRSILARARSIASSGRPPSALRRRSPVA
jgi:hypothetical protein